MAIHFTTPDRTEADIIIKAGNWNAYITILITKTACEHENVQIWKKILSWVSSHDLYLENKIDKRKRSITIWSPS